MRYRVRAMPTPVLLAASYLIVNLAITVWMVREEARGNAPAPGLALLGRLLRYGPPLLGLLYLVTIAGDWPFFLFVVAFFLLGFYLLDRGLNFPPPPRE
jgi:hypothetical protein